MDSSHAAPSVVFKVLGPLEVRTAPGTPELCGKPAKLLALLLLNANSWVVASQIPDALWTGTPPASADRNVKTYIWQLRRTLPLAADGGPRVEGKRGGYRIRVAPGELDAAVVEDVARYGDINASVDSEAPARLQAALELWRGTPFAELPEETSRLSVARLDQLRWQIREQLADALIIRSRFLDAVAVLQPLTAEDPLREGLWTRLVLALNGAGLRAEALAAYQGARRVLIEELGVEPGPALQEAHRRALAGESSCDDLLAAAPPVGPGASSLRSSVSGPPAAPNALSSTERAGSTPVASRAHAGVPTTGAPPPAVAVTPPAAMPAIEQMTPSFLPRDVPDFVGRDDEIDAVLAAGDYENDAPPIAVIEGMPGVGKTALAVHVAHRLRSDFPDGQVFCDMHGHDPDAPPAEPVNLLAGLLEAFGVPPTAIPDGLERRAGLWRSVLAGRQVILVLDDAVSTAQIRPLLPGSGSCLVMVTSRRRMSELDGVQFVQVDPLPDADALELLAGAGTSGASAETDAAANLDIVRLCGNLPAAIRIAASRLRQHPYWNPTTMAGRLQTSETRLAELRTGDRDVSSLLAMSYAQLTTAGQNLFRVLATATGTGRYSLDPTDAVPTPTDVETEDPEVWQKLHVDEIGPLVGMPVVEVEQTLEQLLDHHLVTQFPHDRYGMHTLLRQFGSGVAADQPMVHRAGRVGTRVTQSA